MDEAFEKYLQDFLKRYLKKYLKKYNISSEDIYFDDVSDVNTILRQLENYDIDLSEIQRHLEVIFDLLKKGIFIYKDDYKSSKEYSLEKDTWIPTNENVRISTENYIERFLLTSNELLDVYYFEGESKYAMGNPRYLYDEECKLAEKIIKRMITADEDTEDEDEDEDETKTDKTDYLKEIADEIKDASNKLLKRLFRPLPFIIKPGKIEYGPGGLIAGLKKHLNFDITLFTAKEHGADICKIIYLFAELQYKLIPELQGQGKKSFKVIDFLSKPSMENTGYSFSGRRTYNGRITDIIKNKLEKEMYRNETSLKAIDNIRAALDQVASTWDKLLDQAHDAIDKGEGFDFDEGIRVLQSILGKPQIASTLDDIRPYALKSKFLIEILDSDQEKQVLDSICRELDKAAKDTSDEVHRYTFKTKKNGKKTYVELDYQQGRHLLNSIIDQPHIATEATWDDAHCYKFAVIGTGKEKNKQAIQVWESIPDERRNTVEKNIYQASPIATLYLKISQFERLGEVKDKILVNGFKIKSKYKVPPKFVGLMESLKKSSGDIDDVKKVIEKHLDNIAKSVYPKSRPKSQPTIKEWERIKYNAELVTIVLKFRTRARPFMNMEKEFPALLIASCLQAILVDVVKDAEYTFYNYEQHVGTTHKIKSLFKQVNESDKDKYFIEAAKFCWAQRMQDHWYANLGKYDLSRKLREFENNIYEVLTEIYSCPNISEMKSMSQDYYSKLEQAGIFC